MTCAVTRFVGKCATSLYFLSIGLGSATATATDIPASGFGTGWGNWTAWSTCPSNAFATGFRVRLEPYVHDEDDTALNAVEVLCRDVVSGRQTSLLPHAGLWGSWSEWAQAPAGEFLNGFLLKVEQGQGNGDDTSVNAIRFTTARRSLRAGLEGPWGAWASRVTACPKGEVITGLRVRFEGMQRGGDDTALNDVGIRCAKQPQLRPGFDFTASPPPFPFPTDTTHHDSEE